jgi:EAL domain-containing protein (putative c-di-GMP-specific phosphodiesterase class I)
VDVSSCDLLHGVGGSEAELRCLARFWEWERFVRQNLPAVLEEKLVTSLFQTLFRLSGGLVVPCGYEALARFTTGPGIPVGLWFRTAREAGFGAELEKLAAGTAVDSCSLLPAERFLNVNVSLGTVCEVVDEIAPHLGVPLVVDIPHTALWEEGCRATFEVLRSSAVAISLDDTPLDQLFDLRPEIEVAGPDYLKVDVLVGLFDSPMGRFNLAEGAAWCRDSGIVLIAERVEALDDLEMLYDLGVEMAQGYSLARPV